MQKGNSISRIIQIDGIKGVIIFFIIFVHYYNRMAEGRFPVHLPTLFVSKGWIFTEFFFIISGFLFANTCKKNYYDTSIFGYMAERLKRIYIPCLFATTLDVAIRASSTIISRQDFGLTVTRVIKTLTFSDTLLFNEQPFPSVLWYVHVLMLCYLLFFTILKQKKVVRELWVLALLYLSCYLAFSEHDIPFLYQNVGRGLFSFLIGMIISMFQEKICKEFRYITAIIATIFCVIMGVLSLFYSFDFVLGNMRFCMTTVVFPTVLIDALNLRIISNFFRLKLLVYMGKISMSIFLVHVPVLNLFGIFWNPLYGIAYHPNGRFRFDTLWGFFLIMSVIIATSIIWFYFVEKKACPYIVGVLERSTQDKKSRPSGV